MKHNYPFLISGIFLMLIFSIQLQAASFNGSVILTNTVEQIECEVTINDVTGNIHFRLTGPADRWFAFAFGTNGMSGYTLVANSTDGTLMERNMVGTGQPGLLHVMQNLTNITTSTPAPGRIQIDADRLLITGDPLDFIFPAPPITVNMVYGVIQFASTSFGYHGGGSMFRGPTTLVFTPLPIELTTFDLAVEGNAGVLSWETATEVNSTGFEIERSYNAEDWEKIGFVEANGNSSSTNHYNFRDEALLPGPNYYRIKMLDVDGSFEYSVIRAIDFNGPASNEDIIVSPNPVISNMTIRSNDQFDGQARVIIYNTAFQKVRDEFWENAATPKEFNLSELSAGPYFIYIKHKKWSAVLRVIKAR